MCLQYWIKSEKRVSIPYGHGLVFDGKTAMLCPGRNRPEQISFATSVKTVKLLPSVELSGANTESNWSKTVFGVPAVQPSDTRPKDFDSLLLACLALDDTARAGVQSFSLPYGTRAL